MSQKNRALGPRFGLAIVLVTLVVLDGWSMDAYLRAHSSPRVSIIALGVCAVVSSIHEIVYLRVVSTGRRGWLGGRPGASISYVLALVIGGVFFVVTAFSDLVSGMT
jgi:hypothetical protein